LKGNINENIKDFYKMNDNFLTKVTREIRECNEKIRKSNDVIETLKQTRSKEIEWISKVR
jgi:hypothetical protein